MCLLYAYFYVRDFGQADKIVWVRHLRCGAACDHVAVNGPLAPGPGLEVGTANVIRCTVAQACRAPSGASRLSVSRAAPISVESVGRASPASPAVGLGRGEEGFSYMFRHGLRHSRVLPLGDSQH